jgi:hypothetical protein
MTGAPGKPKEMGETCKAYLMQLWIEATYGRRKEFTNKYIEKGLETEEDGITLYSLAKGEYFTKNTERFENNFVCGTPDIITETEIVDIKSSWDIFTFHDNLHKATNKNYKYQLMTYMALTKKKVARLVYVLVDAPDFLVEREKDYLARNMGLIDRDANPDYLKACEEIEKSMRFGDIDKKKRYIEITIEYDPDLMAEVYQRIKLCRGFMNSIQLAHVANADK